MYRPGPGITVSGSEYRMIRRRCQQSPRLISIIHPSFSSLIADTNHHLRMTVCNRINRITSVRQQFFLMMFVMLASLTFVWEVAVDFTSSWTEPFHRVTRRTEWILCLDQGLHLLLSVTSLRRQPCAEDCHGSVPVPHRTVQYMHVRYCTGTSRQCHCTCSVRSTGTVETVSPSI